MKDKPIPKASPETQPFWDGCAIGELRIEHCASCEKYYFPPRPFCPSCQSTDVEWRTVTGAAKLHTYTISHRAAPGFEDDVPYAIAIVELDEGPRMMTSIVGVENTPELLVLDMPLRVAFDRRGDVNVPVFTPA
jgi:uncharacterized OB-fold protein